MITFRQLSIVVATAGLVAVGVAVWRTMMRLMEPEDVYSSGLDWVQPGPASGF